MWDTIHRMREAGNCFITGHTAAMKGATTRCRGAPIVGVGTKDQYVTPKFAKAGDKIIITKGRPLKRPVFSPPPAQVIEKKFGKELLARKAEGIFLQMSVWKTVLLPPRLACGRTCHAMHDATEWRHLGPLYEMGHASRCGVRVEKRKNRRRRWELEESAISRIDPYASISEERW